MAKIKFGTDGWRAVIAREFTVDNVARVTQGVADWLNNQGGARAVVVGHDCRFAGELFAETVAQVLVSNGITVHLAKGFVSTPMVSLGAKELGASLGVILTASHNSPSYHGYKLKGAYGGPMLPDAIAEVEALIPDTNPYSMEELAEALEKHSDLVKPVDLETRYCDKVNSHFDLEAIRKSGIKLAYDAMYGAGQRVLPRLLPEAVQFRCDYDPTFQGILPEPIERNLLPFMELVKADPSIQLGLATDGDADRIGMVDENGRFLDAHILLMLLIHYLCHYKGWSGKVVMGFSSSERIKRLCGHYGLEVKVVPIGFKHISGTILVEDILAGGEESGGITLRGYLPERDGIWIGLKLLELMTTSGKSMIQLVDEVTTLTGSYAFERLDLHLSESEKQRVVNNCKDGKYSQFGSYSVIRTENLDGFKFYFNDSDWVMIRPSGTEPVLRVYAEASNAHEAVEILKATRSTILPSE